jgi:lysophospholipase L1-like esterase
MNRPSARRLPLCLAFAAAVLLPHPANAQQAGRFDAEIAAFERADGLSAPPRCAMLFVGSSSIRLWKTLEQDFPARTVINRGFGGSTIAEAADYFDRIIRPYKPAGIVFYSGENDLAAGRAPEQAFADFERFMALKSEHLGATPVWFISSKPSKLRFAQIGEQRRLNGLVAGLADSRDDLAYIDVAGAMLKPDGSPKDLFVSDDLHMTAEGYAIWTPIVEAALKAGQSARAPGC